MRLSLIVIGQNEASTLSEICEQYVRLDEATSQTDKLEMIFVDSDSDDNSIAIVNKFRENNFRSDIIIVKISGAINAAVARNVGYCHSDKKSEYIFFLDGDIVFKKQFVIDAITILKDNQHIGSVTGFIYDHYYACDNAISRYSDKDAATIKEHGGNFITRRSVIEKVGLFDEALVKHQDIDYAFRIRMQGLSLYMINQKLGEHYTTHYLATKRIVSDLKKMKYISSGILFRKYIFTRLYVDMLNTGSIKGALIRVAIWISLFFSTIYYPFIIIAIIGIVLLVLKTNKDKGVTVLSRLFSILTGLQFLAGLAMPAVKNDYREQLIPYNDNCN